MKNSLFVFIFLVLILSLLPISRSVIGAGDSWKGIMPSFVDDDLYYYARMQNIINGYPLVGNPYFFEHREQISPAFFIPDWISVFPSLIGMNFLQSITFNLIFWSISFYILGYLLFVKLGLPKLFSMFSSFILYLSIYPLLIRPVSMQVVAPFFIFFFISFILWIREENLTLKNHVLFVISSTATFYVYAYLWQIVVIVFGITFFYFILCKNVKRALSLFKNGLIVVVLSIPTVLYTLKQINSDVYWETMARIGLVNTHIPTFLSFYDGFIILGMSLVWILSFYWIKDMQEDRGYKNAKLPILIVGVSIFISLFTNVVTGKELEISNHIERFIIIWVPVGLLSYFWFLYKYKYSFTQLIHYKKILLLFLIIFSIYSSFAFGNSSMKFFSNKSVLDTEIVSVQKYVEPLDWLNSNAPKESVLWSNGEVGYYIPIVTTNFQLFNPLGGLHLVSSNEMEERYLVSSYFDNLTLQDIENDFRKYAGVGNSIHQYKTYNRKVKICKILGFYCGMETNAVSYKGNDYFIGLHKQYLNSIKPNLTNFLNKYNVSYILRDKTIKDDFNPSKILGTKLVWYNDFFEIYTI